MDENKIIILNEEGKEIEIQIISYFTLASNNKEYIIYTEEKEFKDGKVEVSTSEIVTHEDGSITLEGIEDEAVWEEIKEVMEDIADK